MGAVAKAALLALATAVAGCGEDARGHRDDAASRPLRSAVPADGPVGRRALRTVGLLRSAGPLTAVDRELLPRGVPSALPFMPEATAAVSGSGLSGGYWVAAGVVGAERAPGICLFVRMASASTVGAGCFDYATVDAGRAVQLLATARGSDVIGIAPDDVHEAAVSDAAGHSARIPVDGNVYAGSVSFEPRTIRVRHLNRIVELRLRG